MPVVPQLAPPQQLHNVVPHQEQKKKHEREFLQKSAQVEGEMKGCVDQIDMLSRRVFEGTYQLIQMKFTNAAQGSVEEAAQN